MCQMTSSALSICESLPELRMNRNATENRQGPGRTTPQHHQFCNLKHFLTRTLSMNNDYARAQLGAARSKLWPATRDSLTRVHDRCVLARTKRHSGERLRYKEQMHLRGRVSLEQFRQQSLADPTGWRHNGNNEFHPKSSDFVHHNGKKDTVRVDGWNTSERVTRTIERKSLPRKDGGGRIQSRMTLDDGECATGRADALGSPQRDEFSWTALIWQHIKAGQNRQALRVFNEMQEGGVKPSSYTYVAVLKACSGMQDLESARQVHAEVVKSGLESIVFVGNSLVHVYAKCGSLVDARHVFEMMPSRNVVSWNSIISGYASMGDGEEALQLYARMKQEGGVPDGHTFLGALKACSNLAAQEEMAGNDGKKTKQRCLEQVRAIHSDVVRRGSMSDVFVANILVDVYAKCGSLVDARSVFEKMRHRTAVSWTAMILGYAQVGEGEVALQLYAQMQQEGVQPDAQAFVGALKACSSLATLEQGGQVDGVTVRQHCLDQVRAIHSDVVNSGSESNVFVGSLLVDVYAKCGSLGDARDVFDKMPHRNVVSWTAMVVGYAQMDEGRAALDLFAQMQEVGVVPNGRTFVGALKACGIVAGLEAGKGIHAQLSKLGVEAADSFLPISLIDMYSKCGSMVDAQQVFDTLPTTDMLAWSALIAGYAHQGESARVFDLFEQMKLVGIQPKAMTFLSLLTVCSHEGLVDKGQTYFEAMSRDYGVKPTIEHYTCMIDLLSRAGQMDEAMALVKTMPFQPDGVVWRTVLGACRKWKNVALGRQAFECAIRLDKDDASAYVLMSNIYAVAHMVEEAKEVQSTRVNNGAWKKPGQSWWTDLGGSVHAFVVGDRQHPENEAIYVEVEDLILKMKAAGCIPQLDSVLRDIPGHDLQEEDFFVWLGHREAV